MNTKREFLLYNNNYMNPKKLFFIYLNEPKRGRLLLSGR